MSFEDFVLVESRKAFQGKFMGTDYFIRFVKDWSEVNEQYGDVCFKNSGYAKITAKIADSTDSLFTPCTYKLDSVKVVEGPKLQPIQEIVSFRGRFCEELPTNLREPPQLKPREKSNLSQTIEQEKHITVCLSATNQRTTWLSNSKVNLSILNVLISMENNRNFKGVIKFNKKRIKQLGIVG